MPLLSDPQHQMTALQWSVLRDFFSSPLSAQFFLTGGTALTGFYFGHRTSVDLDFFTLQTFDHQKLKKHLETIAQTVGGEYSVKTDADTLLTGIIKVGEESLKVDLVQDIPVHIGILQTAAAIRIDALENIGSNKITAIYGRLSPKDFVDLYWILEIDKRLDFEELLKDAKKKDLGIVDFHLGMIFLNPPPMGLFPATTPPVKPETMIEFFKKLGEKLVERSEKPRYG